MAEYLGRRWTRSELLARVGDPQQVAGATPCVLTEGKAEGVRAVALRTGGGLELTVLPGRGMDIAGAWFRGRALGFLSGTGITAPAYYEEPGLGFLRSFYGGLLTTCGISYSGAPGLDQGRALGLHGRLSNAAAEDLCVSQDWEGDEYRIRVSGRMREAQAMGTGGAIRDALDRLGVEWRPYWVANMVWVSGGLGAAQALGLGGVVGNDHGHGQYPEVVKEIESLARRHVSLLLFL